MKQFGIGILKQIWFLHLDSIFLKMEDFDSLLQALVKIGEAKDQRL